MTNFVAKVNAFVRGETLFAPGDSILIGCSGGPDSLALALYLAAVQKEFHITAGLAYVHHHLRAAADAEVEFVRALAQDLKWPFYRLDADVPRAVQTTGESVETAARALRYRALGKLREQEGYTLLAVAHHADDQAETVLHHVLRGTGLTGLGGMRARNGSIVRPFLGVTRAEIETYLTHFPYTPCLDETNTDTTYLRNALRHEVLPYLAQYNPRIREHLVQLATTAAADDEYLDHVIADVLTRITHREAETIVVSRDAFNNLPTALQRRVVRKLWREESGTTLSFAHTERLVAWFATGETGTEQTLYGLTAVLTATDAWLAPQAAAVAEAAAVTRTAHDPLTLGDVRVRIRTLAASETAPWVIPARVLTGPLTLRYRRAGDRIPFPFGTKKLSDYFIDSKVPRRCRDSVVLLADDRHVYAAFDYFTLHDFSGVATVNDRPERLAIDVQRRTNNASKYRQNTGD